MARWNVTGIANKVSGIAAPFIIGLILFGTFKNTDTEAVLKTLSNTEINKLADKAMIPFLINLFAAITSIFIFSRYQLPVIEHTTQNPVAYKVEGLIHLIAAFTAVFCAVGIEVMCTESIVLYALENGANVYTIKYLPIISQLLMLTGLLIGLIIYPKYLSHHKGLKIASFVLIFLCFTAPFISNNNSIFLASAITFPCSFVWSAIFSIAFEKNTNVSEKKLGTIMLTGICGGAIVPLLYSYLKQPGFADTKTVFFGIISLLSLFLITYSFAIKKRILL